MTPMFSKDSLKINTPNIHLTIKKKQNLLYYTIPVMPNVNLRTTETVQRHPPAPTNIKTGKRSKLFSLQ